MVSLAAVILTASFQAGPATPSATKACLHQAGSESPEQQLRKRQALGLARTINSAEAAFRVKAGTGRYGDLNQLVSHDFLKPAPDGGQYVPGFAVRLDLTEQGYWFAVVDTTDACGFRFISNQDGLILTAQPIQ